MVHSEHWVPLQFQMRTQVPRKSFTVNVIHRLRARRSQRRASPLMGEAKDWVLVLLVPTSTTSTTSTASTSTTLAASTVSTASTSDTTFSNMLQFYHTFSYFFLLVLTCSHLFVLYPTLSWVGTSRKKYENVRKIWKVWKRYEQNMKNKRVRIPAELSTSILRNLVLVLPRTHC